MKWLMSQLNWDVIIPSYLIVPYRANSHPVLKRTSTLFSVISHRNGCFPTTRWRRKKKSISLISSSVQSQTTHWLCHHNLFINKPPPPFHSNVGVPPGGLTRLTLPNDFPVHILEFHHRPSIFTVIVFFSIIVRSSFGLNRLQQMGEAPSHRGRGTEHHHQPSPMISKV